MGDEVVKIFLNAGGIMDDAKENKRCSRTMRQGQSRGIPVLRNWGRKALNL